MIVGWVEKFKKSDTVSNLGFLKKTISKVGLGMATSHISDKGKYNELINDLYKLLIDSKFDNIKKLQNVIVDTILTPKTSDKLKQLGQTTKSYAIANLGDRTVAEVLDINEEQISELNGLITSYLITLVVGKVPDVLKAFDARKVVVDTIDELPVEQVENVTLGAMKAHLKWINVFGAILGALIGCIQIVIQLVAG
jgi:uncharacterized membrane protein YheB (UPF0754 family)